MFGDKINAYGIFCFVDSTYGAFPDILPIVTLIESPAVGLMRAGHGLKILSIHSGMRDKIFISYRREDVCSSDLSIGQYLEHQFGRRNVFIDVDMHAGAKFPTVLEQRLAECKVMLVLIGPGWLNARDEKGHRRLDNPEDWVRLEIAHALKRNITVIPVRVNGAELPGGFKFRRKHQSRFQHVPRWPLCPAGRRKPRRALRSCGACAAVSSGPKRSRQPAHGRTSSGRRPSGGAASAAR